MNIRKNILEAMSLDELQAICKFLYVKHDGDREDLIKRIATLQKLTAPWVEWPPAIH